MDFDELDEGGSRNARVERRTKCILAIYRARITQKTLPSNEKESASRLRTFAKLPKSFEM